MIWQPDWGLYRGRPKAGSILIDGGALSNFPLWLFTTDHTDPFIAEVLGPAPDKTPNLGLFLDDELPMRDAPPPPSLAQLLGKLRTVQRITRIVETVTVSRDKLTIEYDEREVCRLPTLSYAVTEFNMTDARRAALIAAGRAAMHNYLFSNTLVVHRPTGPPLWARGSQPTPAIAPPGASPSNDHGAPNN